MTSTLPTEPDDDRTVLQQSVRTQLRLRELIFGAEIEPGVRIAELALLERLGGSRPVAEGGVGLRLITEARDCVDRIDDLLAAPSLSEDSFSGCVHHDGRLHELLAGMAGSATLQPQLERAKTLPFALPNARAGTRQRPRCATRWRWRSNSSAACPGPSSATRVRAESPMREHVPASQFQAAPGTGRAAAPGKDAWRRAAATWQRPPARPGRLKPDPFNPPWSLA